MKEQVYEDTSEFDFEVSHAHLTESEDFLSFDSIDRSVTWNIYISDTKSIVERECCGIITLHEEADFDTAKYIMKTLMGF